MRHLPLPNSSPVCLLRSIISWLFSFQIASSDPTNADTRKRNSTDAVVSPCLTQTLLDISAIDFQAFLQLINPCTCAQQLSRILVEILVLQSFWSVLPVLGQDIFLSFGSPVISFTWLGLEYMVKKRTPLKDERLSPKTEWDMNTWKMSNNVLGYGFELWHSAVERASNPYSIPSYFSIIDYDTDPKSSWRQLLFDAV